MSLIHPTAIIDPKAELHPTVKVGAFAVIGADVKIGENTIIDHHVIIDGVTEIGTNNHIFPGSAIGLEPQDLKYQGDRSLVKIGNHNKIREYVTINRATGTDEITMIGDNNLLMAYVHVAHNCVLENNIIIANAVALAGHVHIESKAVIGGVLGVHQFVHIGKLAMVGGMSRIDRDVPPYMLVEGSPSRVRTLNLIGLKRAGFSSEEISQLKKAFRLLYRSNLTINQALAEIQTLIDSPHLQHLCKFLQGSQMSGRRGSIPGRKLGSNDD
jgi:UDP-N-acetylglucosamine acyltransferase